MVENETAADNHKSKEASDKFGHEDVWSFKQNDEQQSNGYKRVAESDVVEDHPDQIWVYVQFFSRLFSLSLLIFLLFHWKVLSLTKSDVMEDRQSDVMEDHDKR